jgi:haloalkane dehalogenase
VTAAALTDVESSNLFREPPTALIDVGQGQVAHRVAGTGPDVLFVHGWPVSGATFRRLLPHLTDQVTCHVIDLVGAGDSTFDARTTISVQHHIAAVRRVVDALGLDDVAVVGHDSGGLIARHALAGDPRVRAWGLIDTEQPQGTSWRFRQFLMARHLPGFGAVLPWLLSKPRLRRQELVLGSAFADRRLLDGEFDEFFLRPIYTDPARRKAAFDLLDSFDVDDVTALADVHRRMTEPVRLVWGERDPFFPLGWAREMADSFADGTLDVIEGARLFVHEERPAEVAASLLATVLPTPNHRPRC